MYEYKIRLLLAAAAGSLIAGCGGGDGSGTSNSETGMVSFAATDAPVDEVQSVEVTFSGVALNPVDGPMERFVFDEPRTIDLLAQTGTASALIIEDTEVRAGAYNFVRLFVLGGADNDSQVTEDGGAVVDLFIPGQQNVPTQSEGNPRFLQLNAAADALVVPAGGEADFTIDFDLRKGLTQPANQDHYLLRPALRLVNNTEIGTIRGEVAPERTLADNCGDATTGNAVYLYAGDSAVSGDVNVTAATNTETDVPEPDHDSDDTDGSADEVNPVTTAVVAQTDTDTALEYTIGFVAEGSYTIAFTCEADRDLPETDEDLLFVQPTTVTVEAQGDAEVVNFTAVTTADAESN